jgi:hypothetical protein
MSRKKQILVRVSEAELTQIRSRFPDRNLSEIVREFLLVGKIPMGRKPHSKRIESQLGWIGNNLNQIAKQVNTIMKFQGTLNFPKLFTQLKKLEELTKKIADNDR